MNDQRKFKMFATENGMHIGVLDAKNGICVFFRPSPDTNVSEPITIPVQAIKISFQSAAKLRDALSEELRKYGL